MTYVPTEWKPGVDGGTLITAERLNNIEQGLVVLPSVYAPQAGGFNFSGPFTSLADATTGAGFIIKPTGDGRQGIFGWQHADTTGYILHFEARSGGAHPGRMIGIGLDTPAPDGSKGVGGILIAVKTNARGIELSNYAENTGTDSYALYVTQSSATAPAVRFEQNVDTGAPALQLVGGVSSSSTAKLLQVVAATGQAGTIDAYSGQISWARPIGISDNGAAISYLEASSAGSTPADQRTYTRMRKDSLTFYGYSGLAGTWYPRGIVMNGQDLELRGGANATSLDTIPATAVLKFRNNALAFFGTTPIAKPTGTPAAATDLATAISLVNSLRSSLIALGLVA